MAARIFSVVDSYDALSSHRPYRAAWPPEKVRDYLKEEAGRRFDPAVVAAFLDLLERGEATEALSGGAPGSGRPA